MHQEFLYVEKPFRDGFWVHICHSQIVYLVNFPFQLVGELWAWCCDIWIHFEVLGWLIPYTELHLRSTAQMLKVNSKETQSCFSQREKKKKKNKSQFISLSSIFPLPIILGPSRAIQTPLSWSIPRVLTWSRFLLASSSAIQNPYNIDLAP